MTLPENDMSASLSRMLESIWKIFTDEIIIRALSWSATTALNWISMNNRNDKKVPYKRPSFQLSAADLIHSSACIFDSAVLSRCCLLFTMLIKSLMSVILMRNVGARKIRSQPIHVLSTARKPDSIHGHGPCLSISTAAFVVAQSSIPTLWSQQLTASVPLFSQKISPFMLEHWSSTKASRETCRESTRIRITTRFWLQTTSPFWKWTDRSICRTENWRGSAYRVLLSRHKNILHLIRRWSLWAGVLCLRVVAFPKVCAK